MIEAGNPTLTIAEATMLRLKLPCSPNVSHHGSPVKESSSLVLDHSYPPLHLTFYQSGEMEGVVV